jgi:methylated-DNA-[protein]-cysteine S-methyltransferase
MALLFPSPLGLLSLRANENGLTHIELFTANTPTITTHPYEHEVARQLTEYFAHTRQIFTFTIAPPVGTPFQLKVWQALHTIPYGSTLSYKELALNLDHAGAWRAVGAACARNPIPIVGACHRVIASSGSLTGFAWGLEAKKYLLNLEKT